MAAKKSLRPPVVTNIDQGNEQNRTDREKKDGQTLDSQGSRGRGNGVHRLEFRIFLRHEPCDELHAAGSEAECARRRIDSEHRYRSVFDRPLKL
jgi:hypothetical protein